MGFSSENFTFKTELLVTAENIDKMLEERNLRIKEYEVKSVVLING